MVDQSAYLTSIVGVVNPILYSNFCLFLVDGTGGKFPCFKCTLIFISLSCVGGKFPCLKCTLIFISLLCRRYEETFGDLNIAFEITGGVRIIKVHIYTIFVEPVQLIFLEAVVSFVPICSHYSAWLPNSLSIQSQNIESEFIFKNILSCINIVL